MDDLPPDLLNTIIQQLGFPDICTLRLANRELCSKVSQGKFVSFAADDDTTRVPFTAHALRELSAATGRGELGRSI